MEEHLSHTGEPTPTWVSSSSSISDGGSGNKQTARERLRRAGVARMFPSAQLTDDGNVDRRVDRCHDAVSHDQVLAAVASG